MNETAVAPGVDDKARRLVWLFGLVYFAQGIAQDGGLVAQPMQYFLKQALGLDPAQATEFLAVLVVPWSVKPLYGLLTDFLPIFGYRRKSWLLVANLLAAGGFIWLVGLREPWAIVAALFLTAVGTAAADVIIDAIMVETGRRTGLTASFQSVQWLWANIASICTSLLGGYLCVAFEPAGAVHAAAAIALLAPLAVIVASWLTLSETPAPIALAEMKETFAGMREAFRSRALWGVVGFLAFWNFSPGFGTVWYYHQVDTLGFSQSFIGTLSAIESFGQVVGAALYWRLLASLPVPRQLAVGIVSGTVSTLTFLLLVVPTARSAELAVAINFVAGLANITATLATLTLAAKACPARSEGSTFAALTSVMNGVTQLSSIVGARLYTSVFHALPPLIVLSAAFTLACFLLMPLVRPSLREDSIS